MKGITIFLCSFLLMFNMIFHTACNSAKQDNHQSPSEVSEIEPPAPIYEKVDVATFKAKINAATDAQVIDVRTPREVSQGMIENAQNINFFDADFKEQVAQLDRNKPVFVYCKVGGRSAQASEVFKNLGFKEVYDLVGGYTAWSAQ